MWLTPGERAHRVRARFFALLEAHPDWSSDELGRIAEEDQLREDLRWFIAQQPTNNAPGPPFEPDALEGDPSP